MGMTIDEAIKRIDNIMFTKFTTVKDEDAFLTAKETMRKYQKIEEIVGNYGFYTSWLCLKEIREVLEDGDDD